MPTHRPRLPLAPATREALVEALKLKLPPGQPLTIDALEAATGQLLRELGPQLMEDVLHGVETAPKKGALLSAADSPRRLKGAKPAR
jgi:hypothetical protein